MLVLPLDPELLLPEGSDVPEEPDVGGVGFDAGVPEDPELLVGGDPPAGLGLALLEPDVLGAEASVPLGALLGGAFEVPPGAAEPRATDALNSACCAETAAPTSDKSRVTRATSVGLTSSVIRASAVAPLLVILPGAAPIGLTVSESSPRLCRID